MGCQAPTLKVILKTQAGPIVMQPAMAWKHMALEGQSQKVITRKRARKNLGPSSATQVSTIQILIFKLPSSLVLVISWQTATNALLITYAMNLSVQAFGATGVGGSSATAGETTDEQRLSTIADTTIGVSIFIANVPIFS